MFEPVPQGVDFDMWLGPAPSRTFNKARFHGYWRMFWDYGGGLNSDWGVHLLDIALWAGDILTPPEKVMVYGANTFHEPRSRETFDSMSVIYPRQDYVINWNMTAGVQKGPYGMPYGLEFICDDATIVVDRNKLLVYPEWDEEAKKPRVEEFKYTEGKESHREHAMNFIRPGLLSSINAAYTPCELRELIKGTSLENCSISSNPVGVILFGSKSV